MTIRLVIGSDVVLLHYGVCVFDSRGTYLVVYALSHKELGDFGVAVTGVDQHVGDAFDFQSREQLLDVHDDQRELFVAVDDLEHAVFALVPVDQPVRVPVETSAFPPFMLLLAVIPRHFLIFMHVFRPAQLVQRLLIHGVDQVHVQVRLDPVQNRSDVGAADTVRTVQDEVRFVSGDLLVFHERHKVQIGLTPGLSVLCSRHGFVQTETVAALGQPVKLGRSHETEVNGSATHQRNALGHGGT